MKKIKNFLIIAMILVLLSIFVFAEVQYGEDLFPEDGEYINISSPAFNFNATSNVSSILTCSLYIGGSINQTNSSVQNNTITSISATNPFEDGTYEWFISCTDDDGTINTSTRNITIDTVPPNVTSITFSHPVIISDNIGEFYTIDITFSEPMNQDESISNMTPPNFTSSIAVLGQIFTDCSNSEWIANNIYRYNCTIADVEYFNDEINFTVNQGFDLAINQQLLNFSENMLIVDTVKPTLSGVIIQSNNVEPYLAKIGDIVTLNFTSSEPIDDVVVTMNGFVAVVTNSTSTSWSATREMNSSDDNGVVEFAINFNDLIGNSGLEVTHITDGVNVTLDKQQPTYVVSYIEGYQYVKNGTTLTINVTFSENISELPIPQISLIGDAEGLEATNLTRVSPTFYTYNWIVGLGNGEMMPEVTLAQDLAGNTVTNEGSTRTNITVDNTPPAINTVVLEDDNMICALPGRTNLNNELVLKANVTDDLSGTNSVIAFYQNVSNNITMDFEPDMEDISSGTLITGETFVNLTYNATTELWELILPLTNTTDAEYDSRVLVIVALDELGNQITSDPEVLIFYDFESPPMFDPCDRNGESTTNFCDIQDWTNVDYTFSLEKLNNESMCGEELPWEEDTWFKVFEVTFFGLDFTQNIEQLFELGSAIVPRITPPGEFGDSYIFVNSTKFEELNVTANISFWGLPFSAEPNITGSQEVSNISFILDTPFNITIDECEFWDDDEFDFENFEGCDANWNHLVDRERYFSYFVPNGTLQFTVAGFSQYDISDTEIPIIEFVKPIDSTIYNGSLEELVFIVNGTGSQVAQIETYIYDELIGTIDYEDIYLSDEYCTNNQSTPDTVTCTLPFEGYEDGEYVFTVVALDFGGEEGNVAQENITYVYDTTIPELTIMSPTNAKYYNGQVVIINLLATDNLDMSLTTICVLSNSTHEINNSLIHGDNLNITSLPVENYTLNCTSTDHAGNTESVEVEFEVVNSESEGEELIFYSNEEYFLDNETTYSVLIIPVNNSLELIHIKEEFENDSYLDVSQLRGSDGVVRFVSGKNLTIVRSIGGHNYTFFIPNGTTLRPENESWDGKLLLPKISDGSYSVSGGDVEFVLELGADFRIDFEEPVLIIIEGVSTDAKAGWTRTGTALTKITTICNDKDAPTNVPEGGMCYLNENGNMYIWTYHFTIFGSYTLSSESSSSSSSSSSGPVNFVSVSDTFFEQGFNRWMLNGQGLRFNVGGNQHSLTVNSVSEGGASVTVASSPQTRTLSIGESWKVNVNGDEFYDVLVTLEDIDGTRVLVKIQQLEELVIPFVEPPVVDIEEELVEEPVVEQPPVVDSEPIVAPQDEPIVAPQDEPGRVLGWLFWVVIVLIVVIIIFMVVNSKKNN